MWESRVKCQYLLYAASSVKNKNISKRCWVVFSKLENIPVTCATRLIDPLHFMTLSF